MSAYTDLFAPVVRNPIPSGPNVYDVPYSGGTITRSSTGSFGHSRMSAAKAAYPELSEIVKRAEANVGAGGADPFNDLWMGDLIHANAISSANILANLRGPRALKALLERGLQDRSIEDGKNLFEERGMRYSAACAVRLAEGIETSLKRVRFPCLCAYSPIVDRRTRLRIWRRSSSTWNRRSKIWSVITLSTFPGSESMRMRFMIKTRG